MILKEDLFHTSGGIFAEQLPEIYQTRHTTTHIEPSPVLSSLSFTSKSKKKTKITIIIIKLKTSRAVEHVPKKSHVYFI
jgi:hypothetical protein